MITVVRLAAGQSGIYKKEKKRNKYQWQSVTHFIEYEIIKQNKGKKETNKEERKRGNERKLIGEGKRLRCNAFGRR